MLLWRVNPATEWYLLATGYPLHLDGLLHFHFAILQLLLPRDCIPYRRFEILRPEEKTRN